jgi:gentisate 1,2-dioxygenase
MAPDSSAAAPPDTATASGMTEYYRQLERANLAPLWESLASLSPLEPRTRARPFKWAYADVRADLLEAGRLITAEKAERRVVVLANPGLPGDLAVTDTLYAGLQLILPDEIAAAHRHSQSAMRFVMEGEGAYTAVEGERVTMHPGDFITTPSWTWHDHGGGEEPVIWMDGLDVPLVAFLHAEFKEEHRDKAQMPLRPEGDALARYGSGLMPVDIEPGGRAGPMFSYPYERSRAALEQLKKGSDPDPWRGYCLKYVNPSNGDWALPTIGPTLSLLPRAMRTAPYKSVDGAVATVVEGKVRAEVDGEAFDLGPGDILALPGWRTYTLQALEESVLFGFSDRPVFEKLGLFREWRGHA